MTAKDKFNEIDVERINVVDEDGTTRLVISNKQRSPNWVLDGEEFERPHAAGMLFYNDEGTECGGLIFGGSEQDGKPDGGGSLTFDRFNNDQVIQVSYEEADGQHGYGIRMWNRPIGLGPMLKWARVRSMEDGPEKAAAMAELQQTAKEGAFGRQRMFLGRRANGQVQVLLMDSQSRPRLRMCVDAEDQPRLEFLDRDGQVTFAIGPDGPE